MKIAIVKDSIIENIGELLELFPNISFPVLGIPEEFIQEHFIKYVQDWKPMNPRTEKTVQVAPYLESDIVYTVAIEAKTLEDIEADTLAEGFYVREQRNQLLKDSDWTQVVDAPVDKPAWAAYRQALRDVTAQEGFPFNVVFPNPPL